MFLRKYSHNIYKVQVVLFLVFIFLATVYYNYPQAHRFFNRMWYENSCFCFDYLFSAIMTILFACFFWIILVYPLVYLFSLFFMKMGWKRLVILLILYLTSFVCEFSLYTIPNQRMFKERRKQNPDEIPTEQTQKVNDDYQAFIENKNDTIHINKKKLYKIFKCDEFYPRDGYYQIPYYGCPYEENELGNANVILIPKTNRFDTFIIASKCNGEEVCKDKIRKEIMSLSIEELNQHFNAVVFIIPKKYLKYTPHLETSYNPKYPYKEDAYVLENGKWSIRKTYTITDEIEQEIHRLQDRYIDSLVEEYRFRE